MRLQAGEQAPHFNLPDVFGKPIALENYTGQKLMVSFYRFASCPFCNLRVHKLIQRLPAYEAHGLQIVSFWQSPKETILVHVGQQAVPFPLIPDPARKMYRKYGLEQSKTAVIKAILFHFDQIVEAHRKGFHKEHIDGDMRQIPADFLINPDSTIHRAYYGTHVGDHLPFAEIDAFLGIRSSDVPSSWQTIGDYA